MTQQDTQAVARELLGEELYRANSGYCSSDISVPAIRAALRAIEKALELSRLAPVEEGWHTHLREADALAIGPNGRGGMKITIDYESVGSSGRLFSYLSDIFNENQDAATSIGGAE